MLRWFWILWAALACSIGHAATSSFDPTQNTWVLTNGWIQVNLKLAPDGHFAVQSIFDTRNGDSWIASPSQPASPIHIQAGSEVFDGQRLYSLLDQYTTTAPPNGLRQVIQLQDIGNAAQFTLSFDLWDNQPVLRYHVTYRNMTASPAYVTLIDMLPWSFFDSNQRYTSFSVNQWSLEGIPTNFETVSTALAEDGTPTAVYSGAHAQQCSWIAIRDGNNRGLFAGWEFDGRAKVTVQQQAQQNLLQLGSTIPDLNHPVESMASFEMPNAFIGLFHGDFNQAGYLTQSFVEKVLAKPAPDSAFPYVAWDSYAYEDQIDEATLLQNATIASNLGVELFIVDLGWARQVGNWYEDPAKFPDGLIAVSNYVHALGMKFGLHFALAEADPSSPVLQANPDWTSTESDGYFGASSLCLSNGATQQWVIQQALHIIDDYQVDWILQDGENMVKSCTKTTHTHDPADSNYANSVQGINAVVAAVQAARPNVSWENCEDGGNMMTFNMVKNYVTSITNDASGDLESRQAAYGATYPFSMRYAERYMPSSDGISPYAAHSYMFGGNWDLMFPLAGLSPDQTGYLKQEIANYKVLRAGFSGSQVYHLQPPSPSATDAIMSYNPTLDSAIGVVTRAQDAAPQYLFRPLGLNPDSIYTVWFEVNSAVYSLPGAQLMANGVTVPLLKPFSSDIVHIDHQQ